MLGIVDDELNKLYIDTQHLLQKYSFLVSESTPLLVDKLTKALKDLDFLFENLSPESKDWEINSCKREYKYWYQQFLHFDELLIPEVIEEHLRKEAEEKEKRDIENKERWRLEKEQKIRDMQGNQWIDEMRRNYYNGF